MLFDLKEFEQIIKEPELKKGIILFSTNNVELLNKTGTTFFNFLIHSKPGGEISLQLKAGKIISYTCFCEKKFYCQHLAAAIFYLQKEDFELVKPIQKRKSPRIKKSILQNYLNEIKGLLKPDVKENKAKGPQLNDLLKKIHIEKEKAVFLKQQFYFDLSIILELPKLSGFNYSEKENKLHELFQKTKQEINILLAGKISNKEKEALIEAAKHSVRSQPNFRTGVFSSLISYACVFIKDKNDFGILKDLIKKRSLNKNRLEQTDRKLIAELQLSIMHAKLLNKTYSIKNFKSTIELPIALAQIEFCKGKNVKGFKILLQHADNMKKNSNKYLDLVEEILRFAKEKQNKIIEEKYLPEKFIQGLFIEENELNYFFELVGKKSEQATDDLLRRLKSESKFYTLDKIAVLLLNQNRSIQLLEELKREKNKFRIMNELALKMLPDNEFIKLYVKHLSQAITEAKFPYFQEQVLNSARNYIDKLETEQRNFLLRALKEKMMYDKCFHNYVEKTYPDKG